MSEPTYKSQIEFLEYIQRLLDGGGFTASYKFALLMALADLSVEKGDDSGAPLQLHARDVALKFVRYYARQAAPFKASRGGLSGILHQNTDKQARIVNLVMEASPGYAATGFQKSVKSMESDGKLVSEVTSTVAVMPLWKLQTIGGVVEDFLYPNIGKGRNFELRPGIAFCFRKFHGFITRLAQDGWVRFVRERKQNKALLGNTSDLAQFMFGVDRASLIPYRELLVDLQKGKCFYCGKAKKTAHVDHFIPWSWYSLDLGHNFVLACEVCNGQKRDMLAAPIHLKRWLIRNEVNASGMSDYFTANTLPNDAEGSLLIAKWAYGRVAGGQGATWINGKAFQRIGNSSSWTFPG